MGVGDAARDAKLIDGAVRDLALITGQKPQVRRATKSIAQFKLREGMPIGAKVTLRGDRMWEFLDRLLSIALPRIRDFRGLSRAAVRRQRQLHFRPHRAVDVPEIDVDKIDRQRGMDITVVTTATNDDEGRALLKRSASRSRRTEAMAKKALSSRRPRSRSSRFAPTPAASGAAGLIRCTASSACAACASVRWPTGASCPASPSPPGNQTFLAPAFAATSLLLASPQASSGEPRRERYQSMTMTDPIADMLTRLRNANRAYHDRVVMPHSKIKANIAEILQPRVTSPAGRSRTPRWARLVVELKYGQSRERSLAGIRRVSKPGLRVYAKAGPTCPRSWAASVSRSSRRLLVC